MNQDLRSYYNERANEYDNVYLIPEEQPDLARATALFRELFFQKTVLEIACGTGYWTKQIASAATSVRATDINESVIDIAKKRNDSPNISFEVADMYELLPEKKYDALFGGFIWSHILLQDLDQFLGQMNSFLKPGGMLVFIDSKQVQGRAHDSKSITRTDEQGNTYQSRSLENGTTHLVLKNFPGKEFLALKLKKWRTDIDYIDLEHYWIVVAK